LKVYPGTKEDTWKSFAQTVRAGRLNQNERLKGDNYDWMQHSKNIAVNEQYYCFLDGRKFAATSSNHFCLVREDVQLGDIIVVPQGAECPILLRPRSDGQFTFVGDCYVHGIMDGEVWQDKGNHVVEYVIM
jgi:hypothetical protein